MEGIFHIHKGVLILLWFGWIQKIPHMIEKNRAPKAYEQLNSFRMSSAQLHIVVKHFVI